MFSLRKDLFLRLLCAIFVTDNNKYNDYGTFEWIVR